MARELASTTARLLRRQHLECGLSTKAVEIR